MDTETQSSLNSSLPVTTCLPSDQANIPPAQLWFGNEETLTLHVMRYVQRIFCLSDGCTRCLSCKQIAIKQHHALHWIFPEKQYTRDDLEGIFSTISFALNPREHYFFIIQKADFLSPACANSLLKSLEEPPPGYHFILLAERQEQVLPTIRSRCLMQSFVTEAARAPSRLFDFFATAAANDPFEFSEALEQSKINERESLELLDTLLHHWAKIYKQAVQNKKNKEYKEAENVIAILQDAYQMLPMPGSSKLFWKNLFLKFTTF